MIPYNFTLENYMGTIYKLNFDSGEFYIGKTSLDLKERIRQHISTKGRGCPLLEFAWNTSKYLGYEIIEDNIPTDILDITEAYYIKKLQPKLNTLPGGEGLQGLNHPRSKYSEEQLLNTAKLIINSSKEYKEIAKETGVGEATVRDIAFRRTHAWLIEKVTEAALIEGQKRRSTHYRLYDPSNILYEFNNASEFKQQHGVNVSNILKSESGISVSGWSLSPKPILNIKHKEYGEKEGTYYQLREFLIGQGLSRQNISSVFSSIKGSKGWKQLKLKC